MKSFDKQPLLNTRVNNLTIDEAVDCIEQMIASGQKSYIVSVNVDVIVKIESDPYLKKIADRADMVLVDGQPLVWISYWQGRPIRKRAAGSDVVPSLCERAAQKGYKIFIIGGMGDTADKAKRKLQERMPNLNVVGTYAPPSGFEDDEQELDRINKMISARNPDILIACFGCPKQEKWIFENYRKYGATVSVCAGATVDFLAGNIRRAPKWMRTAGLEWFYRFCHEPRRMFRRYFIDDLRIVPIFFKYRKADYTDE